MDSRRSRKSTAELEALEERKRVFSELMKRRGSDVTAFFDAFGDENDFVVGRARQRYVPVLGSDLLQHQVFVKPDRTPSVHGSALVYGFLGGTNAAFHAHLTVDGSYIRDGSVHVTILYRDATRNERERPREFEYDLECSTSFRGIRRYQGGRRDACDEPLIARTGSIGLVNEFSAYATRVLGDRVTRKTRPTHTLPSRDARTKTLTMPSHIEAIIKRLQEQSSSAGAAS